MTLVKQEDDLMKGIKKKKDLKRKSPGLFFLMVGLRLERETERNVIGYRNLFTQKPRK